MLGALARGRPFRDGGLALGPLAQIELRVLRRLVVPYLGFRGLWSRPLVVAVIPTLLALALVKGLLDGFTAGRSVRRLRADRVGGVDLIDLNRDFGRRGGA